MNGSFEYHANANWPNWPASWQISEVTAVATDSEDRVFVFSRGDHPVAVFDPGGELLFAWKDIPFTRPHGITIGPDDAVYCVDDLDHTVRKFTLEGKLLQTIGTENVPSDTGYRSDQPASLTTIQRGGGPFNRPTRLSVAPGGDLYVADGYGNARIHHFTAAGELIGSWGEAF